jgi:hypothetical protein
VRAKSLEEPTVGGFVIPGGFENRFFGENVM